MKKTVYQQLLEIEKAETEAIEKEIAENEKKAGGIDYTELLLNLNVQRK